MGAEETDELAPIGTKMGVKEYNTWLKGNRKKGTKGRNGGARQAVRMTREMGSEWSKKSQKLKRNRASKDHNGEQNHSEKTDEEQNNVGCSQK